MAKKKILKQGSETIYPITNESCVLDNNGTSLKTKLGDLSDLITDNKTNLVSAINDIAALNTTTKQQLVNTLLQYGISGSINEGWNSLINKIAEIANNEGTSLQYAQGSFNLPSQALLPTNTVIEHDMGFTPTFIIVIINQVKYDSCNIYKLPITNIELTKIPTTNDSNSINLQITNMTDTSFTINNTGRSAYIYTDTLATYYALGVGNNGQNAKGGLDIISATSLPATGKENQICIISSNPVDKYNITTMSSFNSGNDCYDILLDTSATEYNYLLNMGNLTYTYNISRVWLNKNNCDSYYYTGTQWKQLTLSKVYVLENGVFNSNYVGTANYATGWWTLSSGYLSAKSYSNSEATLPVISFSNMIIFSNYTKLVIDASATSNRYLYVGMTYTKNTNTTIQKGNLADYKEGIIGTTRKTYEYDISSWTTSGYLSILSGYSAYTINIYNIWLE